VEIEDRPRQGKPARKNTLKANPEDVRREFPLESP
jgi:hypothetical protein